MTATTQRSTFYYVSRNAAVPTIAVPTPFDAAVVLDRVRTHVATWPGKQLLEQGRDRLARGFWAVIFPEGTRTAYGTSGKYKIGGAVLADSTGTLVVPVAHNAGKFWGRNSFLKHPSTVVMSIGQPIDPKGLKAEEINRSVELWIEAEMKNLEACR